MQHAPISSTGPQIGYAVVSQGQVIKSTERRPILALSDIAVQISRANTDRFAQGLPALECPATTSGLIPLYAGDNPRIDALRAGTAAPADRVTCSSNATPIREVHALTSAALNRAAAGYSTRPVRA